jgi:histidinol phosphatase-like enzyme
VKILFLDFDGVINPHNQFDLSGDFSKTACSHVQMMLTKIPDLRIVVSSSWREKGLPAVREILKSNGIDSTKVIDITEGPKEKHGEKKAREHHIEHWLNSHPEIEKFVIIDDEAELKELKHKYVKPNPYVGFTQKDMESALKILE